MDKTNIALIVKTDGLEYDDRVRKEILSVRKLYPNINFKIFAVVPDNKAETGITSYGVSYELIKLKSRDKYKSATHILSKEIDFYKTIKPRLSEFDYIWCADYHTFIFAMLCKKTIIWDLHELPLVFAKNAITKALYNYIVSRCRVVVHANKERIDYLRSIGMCKNYSKHLVLRNYPSFDEALQQKDDDFGEFEKWLGNRECVYLQGCDSDIRAAFECVASVIEATDLCAVVIGHFDQTIRKKLIDEFGEEISKRIYFTGMIKQLLTPLYIKKCCLSLVYYKNVSPNNWYCEANRLYQNIVNGNPVICGSNPPMKDLVEKYGFGIATKTDGADINEISEAIKQMLQDISIYKQNVGKKKDILRWESQEDTIKSIMEKLLN